MDNVPLDNSEGPTSCLNNWGNALYRLYQHVRVPDYLKRAIESWRQALELSTPNSPYYPSRLGNLSSGLSEYYDLTDETRYVEESIKYGQEAIDSALCSTQERPALLKNLGDGQQKLYASTRRESDHQRAADLYRQSCQSGLLIRPEAALASSQAWGRWACEQQRWNEALEAFGYGLQAIAKLLQTQMLRGHKEAWLREAQTLPVLAAYVLAADKQLEAAVTTLESGRARLLRETLERNRTDLEDLPAIGYPDLFKRYQAAAQRIAQLESIELREENLPDNCSLVDAECPRGSR